MADAETAKTKLEEYWEKFLAETHQDKDLVGFSGEMVFENRGITGVGQMTLVLSGKKTASFSPLPYYEINREPLPLSGEIYIAEDVDGEPRCILEVTDVNLIPFSEIPWELARRDGEDENLEDWRAKQKDYLEDEAAVSGFDFNDDTKIVCEIFRVIYS